MSSALDNLQVRPFSAQRSPLKLISRRFIAGIFDGVIFGAIAAVTVALLLTVSIPQANPFYVAVAVSLAFLIGFLDTTVYLGGILYALLFVAFALTFGYDDMTWCYPVFLWFVLPLNWLYHILFESSAQGATPGKRLLGLRVCSRQLQRPNLASLSKRHWAKVVSSLAHFFPIAHCVFGNRHQMIHDKISDLFVVETSIEARVPLSVSSEESCPPHSVCAGLLRRVPAALLDLIFFDSIASITTISGFILAAHLMPASENQTMAIVSLTLVGVICSASSIVVPMVIMARLESGPLQSTPGKIALGLVVTNAAGDRISFFEALSKQAVQALLFLSLVPLILIAAAAVSILGNEAQYAEIAIYFSVAVGFSFYLLYGLAVCVTFFKGKQSLLDFICGRYVLEERKFRSIRSIEVVK